jgi:hypothetical protein
MSFENVTIPTKFRVGDTGWYSDLTSWEKVTIVDLIQTAPIVREVYLIKFKDGKTQWTISYDVLTYNQYRNLPKGE